MKWYKEQEQIYYQNGRWSPIKGQFKHEHGTISMFQYAFQPKNPEEKEPSADHKQKNFIGKFCDHLQQNIDDLCIDVVSLKTSVGTLHTNVQKIGNIVVDNHSGIIDIKHSLSKIKLHTDQILNNVHKNADDLQTVVA